MIEDNLPKTILDKAHKSISDELAWKSKDIPDVINALKALNYGILGGNIWLIDNKSTIELQGFVTWKKNSETWHYYVERSGKDFLKWFKSQEESPNPIIKDKEKVFYLVTFTNIIGE